MNRGSGHPAPRECWTGVVALALLLLVPQVARACSVCFGDPNSDLAKGAVRGVAFMIGVVSFVLVGIASIAGVWIVRARRLHGEIEDSDSTAMHQ